MVLTAKCTMALFFTLLCAKFSIMRVGQIPSTNLSSNILNDKKFPLTIMLSLLMIAKFMNKAVLLQNLGLPHVKVNKKTHF